MTLSHSWETTARMQELERRRMPKPRVPAGRERVVLNHEPSPLSRKRERGEKQPPSSWDGGAMQDFIQGVMP